MKSPRIILLLALGMSAPAWAGVAQPACTQKAPDVRNLMNVNEYTKAGLDKLTKQQVQALNAWLARYTRALCSPAPPAKTQTPPPAQTSTLPGNFRTSPKKANTNTADRIVSHIAGEFHGWTGQTRFHLTNGQIWVQAGPGYYETNMKSPKIVIKKLLIGYILQVNGKEVFVRRVH